MGDSPDETPVDRARALALDIYKSSGAMIQHTHLDRQQEVVGVTRDDLEDILGFDGVAAFFSGVGIFLLSGSAWLIVENSLDADGFQISALMSFCIACSFFGLICMGAGLFFHSKKRGRIHRIFEQTRPLSGSSH